ETVNHLSSVSQHGPAIAERHLPYGVYVDLMADVEIGIRIHITLPEGIEDERFAVEARAILQPGRIVKGVGVGVVEVRRQRVRTNLVERRKCIELLEFYAHSCAEGSILRFIVRICS